MFLAHLPSVAVMDVDRRVLKEGDILCELYADTCSDVSDDSVGEFLDSDSNSDSDSDSDVPTASSHKQFQPPTDNHHLYQDNFYNSVKLAETLLDRNVRVCGTMRANRGIPRDLEGEGKSLNRGQSAFRRKGDVMVQV
jgi:hypothetical protein